MTRTNLSLIPKSGACLPTTAAPDATRKQALQRLYERKATLDTLIDSLESYQRIRATESAPGRRQNTFLKCS